MGETGILDGNERVELLDGQVVEMAAIGSRHAACVNRMTLFFVERFGRQVTVSVQNPVRIDSYTELVPDLMLLRRRDDFYAEALPGPEHVLLVVEIADATLEHDRRVKIPVYGRAGVPEAWLVNLPDRRVEVFRDPSPASGYRESTSLPEGRSIEAGSVRGLSVKVAEILV